MNAKQLEPLMAIINDFVGEVTDAVRAVNGNSFDIHEITTAMSERVTQWSDDVRTDTDPDTGPDVARIAGLILHEASVEKFDDSLDVMLSDEWRLPVTWKELRSLAASALRQVQQ